MVSITRFGMSYCRGKRALEQYENLNFLPPQQNKKSDVAGGFNQ